MRWVKWASCCPFSEQQQQQKWRTEIAAVDRMKQHDWAGFKYPFFVHASRRPVCVHACTCVCHVLAWVYHIFCFFFFFATNQKIPKGGRTSADMSCNEVIQRKFEWHHTPLIVAHIFVCLCVPSYNTKALNELSKWMNRKRPHYLSSERCTKGETQHQSLFFFF